MPKKGILKQLTGSRSESSDSTGRISQNSQRDMKVRSTPSLMIYRDSFQKKKRNTSLPLLENPPDEENMKMHLSGLMRLWLSIRALMPPTLPWDLSCQRNLPHRRSIWQTPDCSSHLPSATATIWIMTSTGTFSLIS